MSVRLKCQTRLFGVCLALSVLLVASPVRAQTGGHEGHRNDAPGRSKPSPPVQTIGRLHPEWPSPIRDQAIYHMVLLERLELRPTFAGMDGALDALAWVGTDYNRLWLKAEAHGALAGGQDSDLELQALYGRLVTPFYDFQIGLQMARKSDQAGATSRVKGAIGFQGLVPYSFEMEPVLFVAPSGQVSARLTASRDLLLTQRTWLQGRLETNAALQSDQALGVGAGLNDLELGLRLRHELRREFAPYLGVTWTQRFGETAQLAQKQGGAVSQVSLVGGVRVWF